MAVRLGPAMTPPATGLIARPRRAVVKSDAGLWAMEEALHRRGFSNVAGADEAGRGACAGPLVTAACILPAGARGRIPDLDDSKLLTMAARERVYSQILRRARSWSVVVIPPGEVDARGLHRANVEGLRRALARLSESPDYALIDGFPIAGLGVPALAVWKGDRTAACVAAASVLAKVTRDRLMVDLHEVYPDYDFAAHKGYITPGHTDALDVRGPCPEHRRGFITVASRIPADSRGDPVAVLAGMGEAAARVDGLPVEVTRHEF